MNDFDIEAALEAYDHDHVMRADEERELEEAGAWFDAQFREVVTSTVRPFFEEVAGQLESHGHPALVEEGSISSPDLLVSGGSKITLAFLPKERSQQNLRHQLDLGDTPHLVLRCDKRHRVIEIIQEPERRIEQGGAVASSIWSIEDVTRDHLQERVLEMIHEALNPPYPQDGYSVTDA